MQRLLCVLSAAALVSIAAAQSVVVPNGYANAEGPNNNAYPWNRATASMRIQFVYDSSHFTNQSITFPILINRLSYRADAAATTVTWAGGSWPNVRIDMATCPLDYLAVSGTFASNLGPDLATVLNGPVTVLPGAGNGAGVPGPWYINIPLTTPFLYDPTLGGDLCIDVVLDGTGWTGTSRAADHVGTTATPPALSSRIYNTTSHLATTGTVGVNYSAVCDIGYLPAVGLYAGFSATPTTGPSPLTVNFTDHSYSSAPGGVLAWAWDFDGDTIIDSTLQNPTWVYTTCGSYNVSLTVFDSTFPPNTLTKTAYINTDRIAANFTSQVIGPLTVQFTDTSSMPATSWSWDLDGDLLPDSTVQNPVWVYPNANPVNVTLTATRLCAPPSTITKSVVPAQQLTTNLAANNGVGTPATLYYNLNVLNPAGVNITGLDSISSTVSSPFTVDWYLKLGTYAGFELNPAPWTYVATASGTTNPVANQPSFASFPQPLYLPQGSYGVAMRYITAYPRYVTLPALTTWSNGDLSLTAGSASLSTAGPFTGTNLNSPRGWSGTLYYGTHNVTGSAGYGFFAPGCAGSLGVAHFSANLPQIGSTLNVTVNNLPQSLAIMMVGFSNTGPLLPYDLTPHGAPGCFVRVSPDVTVLLIGAGNTAVWPFAIPNDPTLSGLRLFNQAFVLDNNPNFNALGGVVSDAAGMIIGL
ncbi:MAG: PKD domain-containing protein [Planctomycetes bacterium]|nr:PKD domain-containing protein [Planctomycetota bacterium]